MIPPLNHSTVVGQLRAPCSHYSPSQVRDSSLSPSRMLNGATPSSPQSCLMPHTCCCCLHPLPSNTCCFTQCLLVTRQWQMDREPKRNITYASSHFIRFLQRYGLEFPHARVGHRLHSACTARNLTGSPVDRLLESSECEASPLPQSTLVECRHYCVAKWTACMYPNTPRSKLKL